MALFAIIMSVNLASCSDSDDGGGEATGPLVGIWTTDWKDGPATRTYTFNSDGTYSWDAGVYSNGGKGYYSYNHPQLTMSESAGGTSLWTVVSMEKQYFVIFTQSANTYTFTKSDGMEEEQVVSGTVQGHDYVDLGLSVKWATCNVGATAPEKEGSFFAWGETATKSNYNENTYKWSKYDDCCSSSNKLTKYCTNEEYGSCLNQYSYHGHYKCEGFTDGLTTLQPSDDVAAVKWGTSWRMPTRKEMEELVSKCTWTWTMRNGYTGYKVTGRNGNSIFLPTCWTKPEGDAGWYSCGYAGIYWTASLNETSCSSAYLLYFYESEIYVDNNYRQIGYLVRPVTKSVR